MNALAAPKETFEVMILQEFDPKEIGRSAIIGTSEALIAVSASSEFDISGGEVPLFFADGGGQEGNGEVRPPIKPTVPRPPVTPKPGNGSSPRPR